MQRGKPKTIEEIKKTAGPTISDLMKAIKEVDRLENELKLIQKNIGEEAKDTIEDLQARVDNLNSIDTVSTILNDLQQLKNKIINLQQKIAQVTLLPQVQANEDKELETYQMFYAKAGNYINKIYDITQEESNFRPWKDLIGQGRKKREAVINRLDELMQQRIRAEEKAQQEADNALIEEEAAELASQAAQKEAQKAQGAAQAVEQAVQAALKNPQMAGAKNAEAVRESAKASEAAQAAAQEVEAAKAAAQEALTSANAAKVAAQAAETPLAAKLAEQAAQAAQQAKKAVTQAVEAQAISREAVAKATKAAEPFKKADARKSHTSIIEEKMKDKKADKDLKEFLRTSQREITKRAQEEEQRNKKNETRMILSEGKDEHRRRARQAQRKTVKRRAGLGISTEETTAAVKRKFVNTEVKLPAVPRPAEPDTKEAAKVTSSGKLPAVPGATSPKASDSGVSLLGRRMGTVAEARLKARSEMTKSKGPRKRGHA